MRPLADGRSWFEATINADISSSTAAGVSASVLYVRRDVAASNGVIHVIDTVILPETK